MQSVAVFHLVALFFRWFGRKNPYPRPIKHLNLPNKDDGGSFAGNGCETL